MLNKKIKTKKYKKYLTQKNNYAINNQEVIMKVRTTILIDEDLLKQLKKTAIDGNKSYSELYNEILKEYFKNKELKKVFKEEKKEDDKIILENETDKF